MRGTAYVFDATYDGFLTIIHGYYYEKWRPSAIYTEDGFQQELGAEYFFVKTDYEKADNAQNGINKKFPPEIGEMCYAAFLLDGTSHFIKLFEFIVLCFKEGPQIAKHMHIDCVLAVTGYAKSVLREAHLQREFCRFKETSSGVFYSSISPKNNVLSLLGAHFADRFNFPWVIHDVRRQTALIYDMNACILVQVSKDAVFELSGMEKYFRSLWKGFCGATVNESRKNTKLQRHMNPIYFRKHMTEHQND